MNVNVLDVLEFRCQERDNGMKKNLGIQKELKRGRLKYGGYKEGGVRSRDFKKGRLG